MTASSPVKSRRTRSGTGSRVLIVDDHPLTRYGIARLIEQEPGLIVCGEAESFSGAVAAARTLKPRLILADLAMPGGEGLEFIKDVRTQFPDVTVLVFSMHDETLYAERALRAGAQGYLMKSAGGEKLIEAIRQVLRGKVYLSENMAGKVIEVFCGRHRADDTTVGKLTDREFEVFGLIGQGMTTAQIGHRLRLSVKTVETHRLHVREKLQIPHGPALIQFAVRWAGSRKLI